MDWPVFHLFAFSGTPKIVFLKQWAFKGYDRINLRTTSLRGRVNKMCTHEKVLILFIQFILDLHTNHYKNNQDKFCGLSVKSFGICKVRDSKQTKFFKLSQTNGLLWL